MQAAQFVVRQPQDRFVVIKDRAFRDTEVRLIDISTKRDLARTNRGKFFDRIYHCYVGVGLIFENAQLGRAIISHGTITVEMVGSEVQPEADGWMKGFDRFQLERAHLNREHIEWPPFPRHFGKRFADVPASSRLLAAGIQHLSQQFRRCRFAVRARNSDDRSLTGPPAQLEFAEYFNSARKKIARQRGSRIDAGT